MVLKREIAHKDNLLLRVGLQLDKQIKKKAQLDLDFKVVVAIKVHTRLR